MKLKLSLADVDTNLAPELVKEFENVAALPVTFDWTNRAQKLLQDRFPDFYIYRGGHHIAIHASPPSTQRSVTGIAGALGEAGRCLARILESKNA